MWGVILSAIALISHPAIDRPVRRATGGPLFNDTIRYPSCSDITQHIGDCWFAASLCALAYTNPRWISSKITYTGNVERLISATFKIFDSAQKAIPQVVTYANAVGGNTDDNTADHVAWWVAGYQKAALQAAPSLDVPNDGLDSFANNQIGAGNAMQGIQLLTGLPTSNILAIDPKWSKDMLWNMAKWGKVTPVVLGTKDGAGRLVGGHMYTVMDVSQPGGVKTLRSHNPWGTTQAWVLDDVFGDINEVDHLTNWDQWINA